MSLLKWFRKKKEVESGERLMDEVEKERNLSDLEQICSNDNETYLALQKTMYLDPRKLDVTETEAVKRAKEYEKRGDKIRARVWYEVAGAIAIYKGSVTKVKKYFEKCAKLSPDREYPILKNPEKAVEKAQEYYKKCL